MPARAGMCGESRMDKFFHVTVIVWAIYHIIWFVLGIDATFLERVPVALVATGLWTFVGTLLLRRIRIVRFLFLLAVVGRVVLLAQGADLWIYEDYYYLEMASDPSAGWVESISVLLDGLVLLIVYLTPIADEFERQETSTDSRISSFVAMLTRSDGTIIATVTMAALAVLVVNQFVIGARYAESSPYELVSRAPEILKIAEDSGDEIDLAIAFVDLADAYWVMNEHDQAVLLYEKFFTLVRESSSLGFQWAAKAISRLVQFYSTAPRERFGDGSHALAIAENVPESLRDAKYHDAVARVYARLGQFETAVRHQAAAIDKCVSGVPCCSDHLEYEERLWEYRRQKDGY